MKQFFIVLILGGALFLSGAYYLGLFDVSGDPVDVRQTGPVAATPESKLGEALYDVAAYPKIQISQHRSADPIVLHGVMNPLELEEVPSQVNGRILFIGEQVDDEAVLTAGSAAFLVEPYYFATVYAGRQSFVKFYRRLYDGETVVQDQMLAMIEPAKALGAVLEKMAKIEFAKAEHDAAVSAEAEGKERFATAKVLFDRKAINREDYGAAKLTYEKLKNEQIAKLQGIKMAEVEKDQADIELRTHEIRAVLPYKHYTIKTILKQRGFAVKQADPILVVQNLSKLQAEALIDDQYLARLKQRKNPIATVEPTVLEAPLHELPGHTLDVTSVAVSRDLKIISGSEDKSVCVWTPDKLSPLRKMEHEDAVRVVACTPAAAEKNLCLVGCGDGSIYLWDLERDAAEPLKKIVDAHGKDTSISSLAVSPDGKYFASGASDGSIKLWNIDGKERFAFVPAFGVEKCHDDAVTALHFTPQCRLISAGRDKTLRVWRLKEKGAVNEGTIANRVGNVAQLGVSQAGEWMLFDMGQSLRLLSVESQTLKHTLNLPPNASPFETLAIFSPDGSLILTAGAPDGRLQLWKTPDAETRGFEVRQFATRERLPVSCAAFSPDVGKAGANAFAVSASGSKIYLWPIPTPTEVKEHRIPNVRLTLINQNQEATHQTKLGFEVPNWTGRFEAGRPVTIVIE